MARMLGTARFYSFHFGFYFGRSAFCCAYSPNEQVHEAVLRNRNTRTQSMKAEPMEGPRLFIYQNRRG